MLVAVAALVAMSATGAAIPTPAAGSTRPAVPAPPSGGGHSTPDPAAGTGGGAASLPVDQLEQQARARVADLTAPHYDGTARLPQIPPTALPAPKQPDTTVCSTPTAPNGAKTCLGPVQPAPHTSGSGGSPPGGSSRRSGTVDAIPLPDPCSLGIGWLLLSRNVACLTYARPVVVFLAGTNIPVAEFKLTISQVLVVQPDNPGVLLQVSFSMSDPVGAALEPGTAVTVTGGCFGRCHDVTPRVGPTPVSVDEPAVGNITSVSTVVASGDLGLIAAGPVHFTITHNGEHLWGPAG